MLNNYGNAEKHGFIFLLYSFAWNFCWIGSVQVSARCLTEPGLDGRVD